ncbi:MAG: helix-turn-helix domain-containing protein [Ruminococcaceae bacterium]|nr:helix-turn-helix domain-containing protein [Oscillospiraceae bacterium]
MLQSLMQAKKSFTELPVFIWKDRFSDGTRSPLICKEDSFHPSGKTILKMMTNAADSEYTFTPYHYHDGIEILRVDAGKATVVVNNQAFTACTGDILIFNAFQPHGIFLSSEKTEFSHTSIAFRPHYFFPPEKADGENHFFADLKALLFENHIAASHPAAAPISDCIDRIVDLYERNEQGWAIEVFAQLVLFYSYPVRFGLCRKNEENTSYMFDFMTRVSSYIEENLAEDITTAQIAAYCQYSTEHFCRLFKKCFNKTFKDYLNVYRIRKAKEFIDGGDFSTIAEVSSRFGFNNQNHFGHMFKKYVGILPSEYINRQKSKG